MVEESGSRVLVVGISGRPSIDRCDFGECAVVRQGVFYCRVVRSLLVYYHGNAAAHVAFSIVANVRRDVYAKRSSLGADHQPFVFPALGNRHPFPVVHAIRREEGRRVGLVTFRFVDRPFNDELGAVFTPNVRDRGDFAPLRGGVLYAFCVAGGDVTRLNRKGLRCVFPKLCSRRYNAAKCEGVDLGGRASFLVKRANCLAPDSVQNNACLFAT